MLINKQMANKTAAKTNAFILFISFFKEERDVEKTKTLKPVLFGFIILCVFSSSHRLYGKLQYFCVKQLVCSFFFNFLWLTQKSCDFFVWNKSIVNIYLYFCGLNLGDLAVFCLGVSICCKYIIFNTNSLPFMVLV